MANKKSPVEKLNDTIREILNDYKDNIDASLADIGREIGKQGVAMLKQESKRAYPNSFNYHKDWKYKIDSTRAGERTIIYSATPGLPHLLEYGHAKRGGGRVEGRAHISVVEEQLIDLYTREVTNKL